MTLAALTGAAVVLATFQVTVSGGAGGQSGGGIRRGDDEGPAGGVHHHLHAGVVDAACAVAHDDAEIHGPRLGGKILTGHAGDAGFADGAGRGGAGKGERRDVRVVQDVRQAGKGARGIGRRRHRRGTTAARRHRYRYRRCRRDAVRAARPFAGGEIEFFPGIGQSVAGIGIGGGGGEGEGRLLGDGEIGAGIRDRGAVVGGGDGAAGAAAARLFDSSAMIWVRLRTWKSSIENCCRFRSPQMPT